MYHLEQYNPKGTQTFMKIMRDLEDGNIKFAWVNVL